MLYLHSDHLNTPRLATSAGQQIVWQWQSDAFGNGTANQDPQGSGQQTVLNLRFPGQYFDAESGLHYNYFRDYDPQTGRYVESDPIGLEGGLNTYGYVSANPMIGIDVSGLEKMTLTDPRPGVDYVIKTAMRKDADKSGVMIVYAHGRSDAVQDDRNGKGNRVSLSAPELAAIIRSNPEYREGMPVELRSCETGKGDGSVAEKLAAALNSKVTAPDSLYRYTWNGSYGPVNRNWMGHPDPSLPGTMRTFAP